MLYKKFCAKSFFANSHIHVYFVCFVKVKMKFESMEDNLRSEINENLEKFTELETEKEGLMREYDSIRHEYSQLQKLNKETTAKLNDEINSLQAQITEMRSDKNRAEEKYVIFVRN